MVYIIHYRIKVSEITISYYIIDDAAACELRILFFY